MLGSFLYQQVVRGPKPNYTEGISLAVRQPFLVSITLSWRSDSPVRWASQPEQYYPDGSGHLPLIHALLPPASFISLPVRSIRHIDYMPLSESTFDPYATDKAKEPARLSSRNSTGERNVSIKGRRPTYECTCSKKLSGDSGSWLRKTSTAL